MQEVSFMRKVLSLILAIMLLSVSAFAETQISVSGSGTVQMRAEYAVISLGVQMRGKTVMKAQSQVNETIQAVRSAMAEFGIEETDISTDRISIYTSYESSRSKVDYYSASQTLQIKVSDLTRIGAVIDAAFGAGANSLGSIDYYANDTKAASDQAAVIAVQDAKAKAEVLAAALGLKITGVQSISQSTGYSSRTLMSNYSFTLEAAAADEYTPTLVQPDKISVSVNVSIVFTAEDAQ